MITLEKSKIKPPNNRLPFNLVGYIVTNTENQTALIVEETSEGVALKSLKTFDVAEKEAEISELLKKKYNGDDISIIITPGLNRDLDFTLVGSAYEE